jgi:Plasmid recombination enzyme
MRHADSFTFISFGTITSHGQVTQAARHNTRQIQFENGANGHIDPLRSSLNMVLRGESSADVISAAVKRVIADAGITRLRKKGIVVIEILFSLPVGSEIDAYAYFEDCTRWACERFGAENVVSSIIHMDESAPHAHVLFVPLRDGKLAGSAILGGKAQIWATLNEFHTHVASAYGLAKPRARISSAQRRLLAKNVIERFTSGSDPAIRSLAWADIRVSIERDPERFAQRFGIEITPVEKQPTKKTFVEKMTGTGRRTDEDRNSYRRLVPKKTNLLSSVGDSNFRPVSTVDFSSTESAPDACQSVSDTDCANVSQSEKNDVPDTSFVEATRVRDSDYSPESFNPETGEFVEKKVRPPLQRLAAAKWVNEQLSNKRRVVLAGGK